MTFIFSVHKINSER